MRVLVLRSTSTSCEPIFRPLEAMGQVIDVIDYQAAGPNYAGFAEYLRNCTKLTGEPDVAVMIGMHDDPRNIQLVPPVDVLAEVTKFWPTVHICCDGSEIVWWPQLQAYYDRCSFALQVNIDGVKAGPVGERGLTTLCPIDPDAFLYGFSPWMERDITIGFCGGFGNDHPRGDCVSHLQRVGVPIEFLLRPFVEYAEYRSYLKRCKCVWNHAASGTGDHLHVKARTIEAAFAGAVLLEQAGSPLEQYFTAGKEFLTWHNEHGIRAAHEWLITYPEKAQEMAAGLRAGMIAQHSAQAFWDKVFERIKV